MCRRELLFAALALKTLLSEEADKALFVKVFEAVWTAVRERFYDPKTRGLNWEGIKQEFAPLVPDCASRAEFLALIRRMLRRLRNSHIFLYSREEWDERQNILPFHFQRVNQRVFIRETLMPKIADGASEYKFGDEILSIAGSSLDNLQPFSLAALQDVADNPNFGPESSVAQVMIRRTKKIIATSARRLMRIHDVQNSFVTKPLRGISVLRMLTLNSAELPEERLRDLWQEVQPSRGLVIDLRNCVGGDPKVSNFLAGGLIGENKRLFTEVGRPGDQQLTSVSFSESGVPRYRGKVAILINQNTESQPEVFAAVCREYGCARLIGEHTAGALNGWTVAIPLPENFARFALPYTRGVSPNGTSYEGRGIAPHDIVRNTIADFENGRDCVLERGIDSVQ